MTIRIESVDFTRINTTARQAADLLVRELHLAEHDETPQQGALRYIFKHANPDFGHSHYAVLDDEEVIGAATVAHTLSNSVGDSTHTEICEMAVEKSHQRQGLGRLLIKHIVAEAIEHGDSTLVVWPMNRDARSVYENFGFIGYEDTPVLSAYTSEVLNS